MVTSAHHAESDQPQVPQREMQNTPQLAEVRYLSYDKFSYCQTFGDQTLTAKVVPPYPVQQL